MVETRNDGNPMHRDLYEWKSASVTVAGSDPTDDLSDETGFTTLFDTVGEAYNITVEASATTYIRLNKATNDVITVTSTSPYTAENVIVRKIFIATGGSASTVTVKLA